MVNHWIGVASRDHVRRGVEGGFCQLGHGKAAPLERLKPGDRIIYYSPRNTLEGGKPLQAFTAIGTVLEGPVRQAEMGAFKSFRRDVRFSEAREAPIPPLLEKLSFTRGKASWGYAFRRGVFPINAQDYAIIAEAMGIGDEDASVQD